MGHFSAIGELVWAQRVAPRQPWSQADVTSDACQHSPAPWASRTSSLPTLPIRRPVQRRHSPAVPVPGEHRAVTPPAQSIIENRPKLFVAHPGPLGAISNAVLNWADERTASGTRR